MRNFIKKGIVFTMAITALVSMSGCGKEQGNEERVLRVGETGVYVSATSQIIREKNILEKYLPEGVSVEWTTIATGPDLRDAIISRSLDVADFSIMTYILGVENNLPLTMLSFSGSTPVYVYSNDDTVKALSDFNENSRISITNKSTNLHIAFLAENAKQFGEATRYDNTLVPIPAADALASLQTSKEFNGGVFSFPMSVKANKNENLELIADMTEVIKEYSIGDAYIAHDEYFEENPDIIEALLKAQDEALDFIVNNTEEASQILSELYGVEAEVIEKTINEIPPTNKVVGYDKQASLLYEAGILTSEPMKFSELKNYENIPQ